MENISSEQELLELRRDGRITEDEYEQLLDVMRKSATNDSPNNRRRKKKLWIGLAIAIIATIFVAIMLLIAAVLFFVPVRSYVDKIENKSVSNGSVQNRIVDKIDYPFINDPEIIGTWKTMDFVQAIEDFKAGEKHWSGDLFLKNMFFFDGGRTGGPWTWTEGLIMHPGDKTAAKYHIKEFDGEKYMFFEWKSGDYTIRRMKPRYYVLKKVPETELSD